MDPRFDLIASHPANSIFQVVFFPDRIYHAQYLNATRSSRYRYNVREVRSKSDATVLKGEVFLDDRRLCNFLRIEFRASRLVEVVRERQRFVRDGCVAWVKVLPKDQSKTAEARVKLGYCPWIDAYQVEIWETLEAPDNLRHDLKVLDMMGRDGEIVRVPAFNPALADIENLDHLEMAFRENTEYQPFGYTVPDGPGPFDAAWDNYYERNIQVPNTQEPSSGQNTVRVDNYRIDFQRGWFVTDANQTLPVRYRNAMMNDGQSGPAGREHHRDALDSCSRSWAVRWSSSTKSRSRPLRSKARTSTSAARSFTTSSRAKASLTWARTTTRRSRMFRS